jgi:hypothetical protein
MTPKQAIEKLKAIDTYDQETAHIAADDILCELLKALGHEAVVVEYDKIGKWYA